MLGFAALNPTCDLKFDGLELMAEQWKYQISKSKCQMVDALRAAIYGVPVCQGAFHSPLD